MEESKTKSIAYIVPSFAGTGGYDKIIIYKANYLADVLGYDVSIIAYKQPKRESFYKISDRVKIIYLELKEFNYTKYSIINAVLRYAYKIKLYTKLKKSLSKRFADKKLDIAIATFPRDASYIYKLGIAKSYICELHCSLEMYIWHSRNSLRLLYAKRHIQKITSTLGKLYDKVILLTNEEKERYWMKDKQERIKVIYNPVTLDKVSISNQNRKRIIAVGRICHQKGFDTLVEAWSRVEGRYPDWRLDIIGSTDNSFETDKVVTAIKRYNLKNIAVLPPTKDITEEYAGSSFLVMSSRYEGFGLVLTEAMACGLPCVSFACKCGPRDIITDGEDGLLVEPEDIDGLANAMMQLMSDEEELKRMGRNALEKSKQFELPVIMNQWDKLFKEVIDEGDNR